MSLSQAIGSEPERSTGLKSTNSDMDMKVITWAHKLVPRSTGQETSNASAGEINRLYYLVTSNNLRFETVKPPSSEFAPKAKSVTTTMRPLYNQIPRPSLIL